MKRIITIIFGMLAGLVVLNGAAAQQHAVRVAIPFDFSASGTQLTAGTYTIATENGLTRITKDSTGQSAFVSAIPVIDNLVDESRLVFATYGDQRFLREILCPRLNMTLELLPSKPETKHRVLTASNSATTNPGN